MLREATVVGRVLLYLHPIAGLGATGLAVYAASLGLRSRRATGHAEAHRRRHAALTPWLYALVVLNWAGGAASTWALRPELELAASGHFQVGGVIVAVFTLAGILARRIPSDPRARTLHPLAGAAALLLCSFQVFLGLQLLP